MSRDLENVRVTVADATTTGTATHELWTVLTSVPLGLPLPQCVAICCPSLSVSCLLSFHLPQPLCKQCSTSPSLDASFKSLPDSRPSSLGLPISALPCKHHDWLTFIPAPPQCLQQFLVGTHYMLTELMSDQIN